MYAPRQDQPPYPPQPYPREPPNYLAHPAPEPSSYHAPLPHPAAPHPQEHSTAVVREPSAYSRPDPTPAYYQRPEHRTDRNYSGHADYHSNPPPAVDQRSAYPPHPHHPPDQSPAYGRGQEPPPHHWPQPPSSQANGVYHPPPPAAPPASTLPSISDHRPDVTLPHHPPPAHHAPPPPHYPYPGPHEFARHPAPYTPQHDPYRPPMYAPQTQQAPRQRTAIACRYCRRRKIRCSGFETGDGRCSNCSRFSQDCVFLPVQSQTHAFVPAHALIHRSREPVPLYGSYGQPLRETPPGLRRHDQYAPPRDSHPTYPAASSAPSTYGGYPAQAYTAQPPPPPQPQAHSGYESTNGTAGRKRTASDSLPPSLPPPNPALSSSLPRTMAAEHPTEYRYPDPSTAALSNGTPSYSPSANGPYHHATLPQPAGPHSYTASTAPTPPSAAQSHSNRTPPYVQDVPRPPSTQSVHTTGMPPAASYPPYSSPDHDVDVQQEYRDTGSSAKTAELRSPVVDGKPSAGTRRQISGSVTPQPTGQPSSQAPLALPLSISTSSNGTASSAPLAVQTPTATRAPSSTPASASPQLGQQTSGSQSIGRPGMTISSIMSDALNPGSRTGEDEAMLKRLGGK